MTGTSNTGGQRGGLRWASLPTWVKVAVGVAVGLAVSSAVTTALGWDSTGAVVATTAVTVITVAAATRRGRGGSTSG